MTTAGETIALKSGIGSASAADHLIAILSGRLDLPQAAGTILLAVSSLSAGTASEHLLSIVPYVAPPDWTVISPNDNPNYDQLAPINPDYALVPPDEFAIYIQINPAQPVGYDTIAASDWDGTEQGVAPGEWVEATNGSAVFSPVVSTGTSGYTPVTPEQATAWVTITPSTGW